MRPRSLALTLFAALPSLFFALACGDTSRGTPSPEVIETAESQSRPVTFGAKFSTTPESGDEDEDPVVLSGRVFGQGQTGIILAHMRPSDQTAWFPFATELAADGAYTVLTFDFRGYGESTGDKRFDRIDTDMSAAIAYMRNTLNLDKVFLIGASMGGTASLLVGAEEDVTGIIAISAPAQFPPLDAVAVVDKIREPKLFITSEGDVPQARAQEEFWTLAVAPKDQVVLEGDAHGTDLFTSDHALEVKQRIRSFLNTYGG